MKAIIFDLGGVIVNEMEGWVSKAAAEYYGVPVEVMKQVMDRHEGRRGLAGWDEDVYWTKIGDDLGIARPVRHLFCERYEESAPVIQESIELVKKLRANGYKLAILSNIIKPHIQLARKRGIVDLFDINVFSCDSEVNSKKPEQKIYKICMERLKAKPEECIFIDDRKINVEGAEKLGIKGILYKNTEQVRDELEKLDINLGE